MNMQKKEDAKIYGELIGYGMSGDAYHITAPAPKMVMEVIELWLEALIMANVSTMKNINYLNAHGTSTVLGDQIELNAIMRLI